MPGQEVILGLLDNRTDQIKPLSNTPGLGDLLGGPLAGPPVEGHAVFNEEVHGPNGLLDGRRRVGSVAVDDINIVHVEPLERGLGPFDDVLAGEALVVGPLASPEDLGGNDDVGALPPELPDGLAHDLLGAAVGVDLGVVEEVDAVVAAALEEGLGFLHVKLVAEAHPRTVGELAHLQARTAEVLVLHRGRWRQRECVCVRESERERYRARAKSVL